MSSLLPLLLLLALAWPLVMFFTMRGSHGATADRGQAPGPGSFHDHAGADSSASLDELRRREQIGRQIDERATENRAPLEGGPR